jgi:uncharacterized 2Fe-2S/4Fe-4S cluster protein (DUF4445 family)
VLSTDVVKIDFEILKKLPDLLRQWDYTVRCVVFKEQGHWMLIHIDCPGDTPSPAGLAMDLGTTRVVLRLIDLAGGKTLAESAFDNPQIGIAPDILARIHHADTPGGLARLTDLIITGLNRALAALCRSCAMDPADIHLLAVAGNTAMTHLFMGLNPHWIIREPYIPVVNRPGVLIAADLGINAAPRARALIFPNIGSYFGGDLIAGILYSKIYKTEETAILVDVGTNAEVVLGNSSWLIACAGAAGPALEGGVTRMGMMAAPGVIDRISIDPVSCEFDVHTIEEKRPCGICGSGVIDLAAGLFLAGMVDIRGRLLPEKCGSRLLQKNSLPHLVVVSRDQSATGSDLTISQADLDSLVRSKAAMYTILETLAASVGMAPRDLSTFYVAGTFGSFINPASAIAIGMLPDLPLVSYKPLGNSSLGGAALVLTHPECVDDIDDIQGRITYLELNVNQAFMNRFSAARFLPHTDPALFPSVKKV